MQRLLGGEIPVPHSTNMGLSCNVKKTQTHENEYSYKSP